MRGYVFNLSENILKYFAVLVIICSMRSYSQKMEIEFTKGDQLIEACELHKSTNCLPSLILKELEERFWEAQKLRDIDLKMKVLKPKVRNEKYLAIKWGYNRSFHWGKSDAIFKTPNGKFIVKDAKGNDRPSHFSNLFDYLSPKKFTIPQYNFEIQYLFTVEGNKTVLLGFGFGIDHMKWVFDNQKKYILEGEYEKDIFLWNEQSEVLTKSSFEDVKNSGDVSWLAFEHSDGFNYVPLSFFSHFKILAIAQGKISVEPKIGVGVGLLVPKTRISFHESSPWNYNIVDNKFTVAGYGAHQDFGVSFVFFQKVFVEVLARTSFIRVVDALVDGNEENYLKQPFIGSTQFSWSIGYRHIIKERK